MKENKDLKTNKEEVVIPEAVEPTKDIKQENKINPEAEEEFKEDPEDSKRVPIVPLIIIGVIVVLMIVCVIVILTTGGPYDGPTSK